MRNSRAVSIICGASVFLSFMLSLALFPGDAPARYHDVCEDCHVLHGPGGISPALPPQLNFPNYMRICNISEPKDTLTLVILGDKEKPQKGLRPRQVLIRGSCSGCHGVVAVDKAVSISGVPASAFVRHSPDAILPKGVELPDSLSARLPEGCVDASLCLGCHRVHGRFPNKAPKWNYDAVILKEKGCLSCHSGSN